MMDGIKYLSNYKSDLQYFCIVALKYWLLDDVFLGCELLFNSTNKPSLSI